MSDRGREQQRPPKGLRYVVYAGLGVVVLMMLVLSASVFLGGQGPAGPDYRGTEFAYEYDAGNESLRVVIENATPFTSEDTTRLSVTVDDEEVARFPLPAGTGDAVPIGGVDSGSVVRVVWYDQDETRLPLDRWTAGSAGNATATDP
jgi:hypothetical protein